LGQVAGAVLGVTWVAIMVGTPMLGVWLASSLISFHGGPRAPAVIGGVLLFPVLPVLWEIRSARKWKERVASRRSFGVPPKRRLSGFYRLVARTLAINVVFLAVLLIWFPKTAFTSLATRGDWFLEDEHAPWAETTRSGLFAAASGLEWLHELANPNPYKKQGDDQQVTTEVIPTEEKKSEQLARRWIPGTAEWKDDTKPKPDPITEQVPPKVEPIVPEPPPKESPGDAAWEVGETFWPHAGTVHPVVAAMTAADEASIEAVAKHIGSREADPFRRVKALHDWVVTRLRYDSASLVPGQRKPQDAETVFRNRTGVCEGYARLLVELGKHSADRIVYVVGDVRKESGEVAPIGHAWNAVELRGKWYLMDATWDDPVNEKGEAIDDAYRTDYLFIPPSVAVFDHLPDDAKWQLLAQPLSRGDFMRQPFARPGLARDGLTLTSPNRSVVEAKDVLELELVNPRRLNVTVALAVEGSTDSGTDCGVSSDAQVKLRCTLPQPGRYEARIFTNKQRYGVYGYSATVQVIAR
jgi:transglutaminase-like putative cysteine protease